MTHQQDCNAIEQSNAQLRQRLEEIADQLQDQQNLLNGIFPNDQQRPDVEKSIENLSQQRENLLADLRKGEQNLKDCQQVNQNT